MSAALSLGASRPSLPVPQTGGVPWLAGSALLHAAALAALILHLPPTRPVPMPEQAVTLLWDRQEEGAASDATVPPLPSPGPSLAPPPLAPPAPVPSPPTSAPPVPPTIAVPSPPVAPAVPPLATAPATPPPPPTAMAALPAPGPPQPRAEPTAPPTPAARPAAPPSQAQPPRPRPPLQAAPPPRPAPPTETVWAPQPPQPAGGGIALGAISPARPLGGASTPPPEYPQASRARGEQGRVSLVVRVNPEGRVVQATVVGSSGFPTLDEAAERTVRRWRFEPAQQDGRPVFSTVPLDIRFQLEGVRRW